MIEYQVAVNKAVLTPYEFLIDFTKEASKSETVVSSKTMLLDTGVFSQALCEMYQGVPQGVRKEMFVDYYSLEQSEQKFLTLNALFPHLRLEISRLRKAKGKMFNNLRDIGINLVFINPRTRLFEKYFPVIGADHRKGAQVDDRVFYFGGLNFDDTTADCAEFMVKFTGDVATKLAHVYDKINLGLIKQDQKSPLSTDMWLLVDAGIKNQSLILDTAVDLINSSEHCVENTAAYMPDGKIAEALSKTHARNIHVEVLTHIPRFQKPIPFTWNSLNWLIIQSNSFEIFLKRFNIPILKNPFRVAHAKLLILDRKWALFGSHNLLDKSVRVGTAEWAILTSDRVLINNLVCQYLDFRTETLPEIKYLL